MAWFFEPTLQRAVIALLAIAAWRWGAGPERAITITMLCMVIADEIYHAILIKSAIYQEIDVGHATIDLGAGVSFYIIALKANRNYPLWVAALQIIAILSHVIREISPSISSAAYSVVMIGPSYLQLLVAILCLFLHYQQTKRGQYPSWLGSSTPPSGKSRSLSRKG